MQRLRLSEAVEAVPRAAFSPRMLAIASYLTGVLHENRRGTCEVRRELFGLEISVDMVSAKGAVITATLAEDYAAQAAASHVDK